MIAKVFKHLVELIQNDSSTDQIKLYCESNNISINDLTTHCNKLEQNVIHLACIFGSTNILQYIWENGGNEKVFMNKDSCYKNALHHSCQHGNLECLIWLFENVRSLDVNSLKKADWTPLMLLMVCKGIEENIVIEMTQYLLDRECDLSITNKDGWSAFHIACKDSFLSVIKLLYDADPNCIDMVSINGRYPIHTASLRGDKDIVEFLLVKGANQSVKDNCQMIPLTDAFIGCHIGVIRVLLNYIKTKDEFEEIIMNYRDPQGQNLLHLAAQVSEINKEHSILIVKELLGIVKKFNGNSRSFVNCRNHSGLMPVDVAERFYNDQFLLFLNYMI